MKNTLRDQCKVGASLLRGKARLTGYVREARVSVLRLTVLNRANARLNGPGVAGRLEPSLLGDQVDDLLAQRRVGVEQVLPVRREAVLLAEAPTDQEEVEHRVEVS
jgi:hypothetical protein